MTQFISLINPDKIPTPWGQVIKSAQSLQIYIAPPIFNLSQDCVNAINDSFCLSDKHWLLGIHWFYKKKFNRHHRVPCSPKLAKLVEPIGDFIWSIVELASEVHAMGHPYSRQWTNAGEWASEIIKELRKQEFLDGISRMLGNDGKKPLINKLRLFLKSLKEYENPCEQHKQPAYWSLIQASIDCLNSKNMPNFRTRHWLQHHKKTDIYTCKGLVASLSSYIALLEMPNSQAIKIKNNSVFVSTSNGDICIKAS